MIRQIVHIDEDKCDGCGLCVPACHEGAIRIVGGKARLVSDRLCDGLGACLGHCPRGAITVEQRVAEPYELGNAVAAQRETTGGGALNVLQAESGEPGSAAECGCPGSRVMSFQQPVTRKGAPAAGEDRIAARETASELRHWPVQIQLVPPRAPMFDGARLLVAADCVPVAFGGFHTELLRGRVALIGCPKLDDLDAYVRKLTEILACNALREIVVARMEVPCCQGLVAALLQARRQARREVDISEVVVGVRGEVVARRVHRTGAAA